MSSYRYALIATVIALVACGGEKKGADTAANSPAPSQAPAAAGPQTPDPGGKVITVNLVTDEKGNYFEPKEVEAHPGDVVRFTLKAGVHNVHFLADSNAGKSGFPAAASDLLQLPGQTYDVKVSFAKGEYFFQCDPHAALGMVGKLEVE
jgi:plastocyanin